MRGIAESWIDECVEDSAEGSMLQVWAEVDGDWRVYFALGTTQSLDETVHEVRQDCFVAVDPVPLSDLLTLIPVDPTDRVDRFESTLERSTPDDEQVIDQLQGDVRMERVYPNDDLQWGSTRPALQFEHWVREDEIPELSDDQQAKAHEIVEEEIGVDLTRYHDYWGSLVIQFEDFRVDAEFDNQWRVDLNADLVSREDVAVVLERREYGELLWQDSIEFEEDSGGGEGARKVVISYGGDESTGFCEVEQANGSSEELIKVLINGETVNQQDFSVARRVVTDITIGGTGQSDSSSDEDPPELYPESDLSGHPTIVAGEQIWDKRKIDFGGGTTSRGWITEAESAVADRALDSIQRDVSSTVKVVDPYLDVDGLTDFVDSLDSDIDVWFITSVLRNASQLESELTRYKNQGQTVEILRIMDQNGGPKLTPLHDRFIITEKSRSWILGTSFNSLDTNVSIISELPMRVTQTLDRQFNRWWTEPVEQKDERQNCNKSRSGISQL
ncbi:MULTISPECIES: hypothetical protein [Halobacteriales]|nr:MULTISPECIES: hypothetical protein [Halobacteriales]MDL0131304.1 hypothetical protein [Halobacterium salinarum]CAP15099.1 uncharacterized protein OE_7106F [Halobacterium salinarum R1]CAP15339.1 uncharacterized protein OE_6226F [Halobacterium salinarum R1]